MANADPVAAASLLADDSRYKKFCTQVDRALQSFESVNEWADFISFLSRLLKVCYPLMKLNTDPPSPAPTLPRDSTQASRS